MLLSFTLALVQSQVPLEFTAQLHVVPAPVRDLAIADFGGSALPDVVVTQGAVNELAILEQLAPRSFAPAVAFAVSPRPTLVMAADLDGDGAAELITGHSGPARVSVLRGDLVAGWTVVQDIALGMTPVDIGLGDLNGDGVADLVVTARVSGGQQCSAGSASGSIVHGIGQGDATFAVKPELVVPNGPFRISLGELNGLPGDELLVGACGLFPYAAHSYTWDGTDQLVLDAELPVLFPTEWTKLANVIGDARPELVQNDGDPLGDLVLVGHSLDAYPALQNVTNLVFPFFFAPRAAFGDLDGDGWNDMVTVSEFTTKILRYHVRETGNPSFVSGASATLPIVGRPWDEPLLVDLDQDGACDVVTVDGGVNEVRIAWNEGAKPPPSVTNVIPAIVPSLAAPGQTLVLEGQSLDLVTAGTIDNVPLVIGSGCLLGTQACVTSQTSQRLEFFLPPLSATQGPIDLHLDSPFGSVDLLVPVEPPTMPVLNAFDLNGLLGQVQVQPIELYYGAAPSSICWLLVSSSRSGSSLPGIVELGIGADFSDLATLVVDFLAPGSDSWGVFAADLPSALVGTSLTFQLAVLDAQAMQLPLLTSGILLLTFV